MHISTYNHHNPEIDIIEIKGVLTGRGAVRLEEYLYSSLDAGRRSIIINLKHVEKADGLGLSVLENFMNRGMRIRLFNAELGLLNLIKISGKEDILKLYNCQEPHEAVLLFEKEMLEEKSTFNDDVKRRGFQRVNTSLQTEFKSLTSHNGEITYRAFIENLSEGGVLVNIIAFAKKIEDSVNAFEMVGKELRDINFSLNGGSRLIETNGECVWEKSVKEEQYAGIRFKNIKQNHNEMIKDYVYERKNS
jgi:ABC-type transporter Mla MlaB component